jgi:hypothetical protein
MKIKVNQTTSPQELLSILKDGLPQYKMELKKNPLFRFEYIQVEKSSFYGAWVRIQKNNDITIQGAIPSVLVRALLGGLLTLLILHSGTKKLENEVAAVLQERLR